MKHSFFVGLLVANLLFPVFAETEFELIYGERLRLPLKGVTRVAVADPGLVDWELSGGEVSLRGRRQGRTLLYIWTEAGVAPYPIRIQAPAPSVTSRGRPRILLNKASDAPSGYLGFQATLPGSDAPQRPFASQNLLLEFPLQDQQRWLLRTQLSGQLTSDWMGLDSLQLPYAHLAYQSPSLWAEMGDAGLSSPLLQLAPRMNRIKGLQVSQSTPLTQYHLFAGLSGQPLNLYQAKPKPELDSLPLAGGSGQLQIPLSRSGLPKSLLALQGLTLSHVDAQGLPGSFLAAGMDWRQGEQARVQLATGSNLSALSLLAQGSYHHNWMDDWLHVTGTYRHLGAGLQSLQSRQTDFLNLRLNSGFSTGWGLSASGGGLLQEGQLQAYQGVLRLGYRLKTTALNLYAQANTAQVNVQQRHILSLGGIWRETLPIDLTYHWLLAPGQVSGHRFQGRSRLWQARDWQLDVTGQGFLQLEPYLTWSHAGRLMLSTHLVERWVLRGTLGYQWQQSVPGQLNVSNAWLASLACEGFLSSIHQVQAAVNYQYVEGPDNQHLLTALVGYTWRFGYENATPEGRLAGLVFHDQNGNGVREPEEPGLANVALRLKNQDGQMITGSTGRFAWNDRAWGTEQLWLVSESLPTGFQVSGANPLSVNISAETPELLIPVRAQIYIQGLVFASPLLARGLDDVVLTLDEQLRVKSEFGGRFELLTTPGAHRLRLEPASIPSGYRLRGGLERQINSQTNVQVRFVLEPLITWQLEVVQRNGQALSGQTVRLFPESEPEHVTVGQTDAQGRVSFFEMLPGTTILEVGGRRFERVLPDQPGTVRERLIL